MLQTEFGSFDGDKWEQICKVCFYRMYDGDELYIHIEATPGDDGIEGFTTKGKVFQCYCPDRSYSSEELYEKQRDKINTDLKKLKNKECEIKKHLGGIKIKAWYLITPEIRKKEIIAYCNKKAEEVRSWSLSIIDNANFMVIAVDIDFIRPELSSVLLSVNKKIIYTPKEQTTDDDIQKYKNDESYLVDNAIDKHSKQLIQGGADISKASQLTHKTISNYLDGKKILNLWSDQIPTEFEKFKMIIRQEEDEIEHQSLYPSEDHYKRYTELKKNIEAKIRDNFGQLDVSTIKSLSNFIVADWILRCPLNFIDGNKS